MRAMVWLLSGVAFERAHQVVVGMDWAVEGAMAKEEGWQEAATVALEEEWKVAATEEGWEEEGLAAAGNMHQIQIGA